MRWRGRRQSENVEDVRGRSGGMRLPGGMGRGGSPARRGVMGGGIGMIIMVVLALVFGLDPSALLQGGGGGATVAQAPRSSSGPPSATQAAGDDMSAMLATVLADTEETWNAFFRAQGADYKEPIMVLYEDRWPTACGQGVAAMGPFYCPGDQKVYLDLSFFDDLRRRHGAPGDFAQAYVVAHEVGHHVQTLLGISQRVQRQKQRVSKVQANQLSVRQELQADCFAGVWAHDAGRNRQLLEPGDVEEGLNAASAIGDDRLQRQSRGYVSPESFTHGSSEQRVRWFTVGLKSGDPAACDTFSAARI